MKQLTYISILLLTLFSSISFAQLQMGRQVLGTTGGYASGTNITVSSTVGEVVTQTLFSTSFILTQGFQQSFILSGDSSIIVTNEECLGKKNGKIEATNIQGCPPFPNGEYQYSIKSIDDPLTIMDNGTLSTGDYDVVIYGGNGCIYQEIIFVGLDSDENCLLKFYSGITPNGDNKNDSWIIDNIEQFPENTVQIFNRWGQQVWWGENYDNSEVVWKGNNGNKDEGVELSSATYFYVAVIEGIDKPFKGWVELTR